MSGPAVFGADVYAARRDVQGRIVAVLRGTTDRRDLYLPELRSRAVPRHVVHELMTTDDRAAPGSTVNSVALLAFFEIETGGVILVGDDVYSGDMFLGAVAGFNETHMPNHQNICLRVDEIVDGEALGLEVEDEVRFVRSQTLGN